MTRLLRAGAALAVVAALTACGQPPPTVSPAPVTRPAPSSSTTTSAAAAAAAPATMLAVGDIGDCRAGGDGGLATATLASGLPGPIAALGDIVYPDGTQADYDRCFWPAWRPLRDRVKAVIGNHDDRNRSVFYAAWPSAGTSARPWYSYRVGAWLVLVVDSNCTTTSCSATSAQTRWLKGKLAASTSRCTLLAMHHPRFSSDDEHGSTTSVDAIWRAAHAGGIDLVLAGHAHDYERIGPVGIGGKPSSTGPVLLVVGTGGTALRGFATVTPASKVRIDDTFGLARLTLSAGGWQAQFLAAPSGAVRDTASGSCR